MVLDAHSASDVLHCRMDVGAAGGGDGGPRRADSVEGGLDIVPLELYDSARAKIDANLRWLFAKAYGEGKCPRDS